MELTENQRQAINELVTTEQNYVKDIQDVYEVYLPCFTIVDGVSSEDVNVIFTNIESIVILSRAILDDLIAARYNLAAIADSFLSRAADLQLYSSYCTRYHRANERLFELKQRNPVLTTILQDLQRSLGHPLPLSSYLHKPVQRILKYHLMLKSLLDSIAGDNPYRAVMAEACRCMSNCAEQINNSKRLTDMDVKTRELHELLLAIRETDHFGKLLREGEMVASSPGAGAKTMFIYMFENVLVMCHKISGSFALNSILRCPDLVIIEECSQKELEFMLVPFSAPSQVILLKAKTLAQKLDWCIQLRKLTEHNIPTKAKKLLLANNDYIQQGIFSSNPEKLTKRRPSLPHIISPTAIGRRVRRRFTSSVADALNKSKSSVNLRRTSSTTSTGSSSLMNNYDSAFESMSLKSDVSGSSDRLSSISSQNYTTMGSPRRSVVRQHSCDDLSNANRISHDFDKKEVNDWHSKLTSRISVTPVEAISATKTLSKSCVELSAPVDDEVYDECEETPAGDSSKVSEHEKVKDIPSGNQTLQRKFLKKMSRWRNGKKQSVEEKPESLPTPPDVPPTCLSQDTNNECEHLNEFDHESLFDFNISQNFSDSLIERFNSVFETSNVS